MEITEIEVSYSRNMKSKAVLAESQHCYTAFLKSWDLGLIHLQEEFKIMLLNRGNRLIGIYHLSKGGMSATYVDHKLIFSVALKCAASHIVVAHNHPSGILIPSQADIRCTQKLKEGCKVLDLNLLDHLIVSNDGYYSFSDSGQM